MLGITDSRTLETSSGKVLFIDGNSYVEGGFGRIFRAHFDCSPEPVAVKVMSEPDTKNLSVNEANIAREDAVRRFKHEIFMLKKLNRLAKAKPNKLGHCDESHWILPQQFPRYYGEGQTSNGELFYVMEWLEPFDPLSLATEFDRVNFANGLCEAVHWLHSQGYVHCDLKPGNIMRRIGRGRTEHPECRADYYAFVDFGTIHKKESPLKESEIRRDYQKSVSVGKGMVRSYPHTPGYADPTLDRHTIYFDIYSIGQILRDMFAEEVPLSWTYIINKCSSRRWNYRYKDVGELQKDIESLEGLRDEAYDVFKEDHDLKRLEWQNAVGDPSSSEFERTDWKALRGNGWFKKGRRPRSKDAAWFWMLEVPKCLREIGAGHDRFWIQEPLELPENVTLVISGQFALVASIIGACSSGIILRDGVSFHNAAVQDSTGDAAVYIVCDGAYLNFPKHNGRLPKNRNEILRRVFQSPHDITHVEFGGPGAWMGLRRRSSIRAEETLLPKKLKKELVSFMKTGNLTIGQNWRWESERP